MIEPFHIHRLDESVSDRLKSLVFLNSFSVAVKEVLQNSIDADAQNLKLKLDLKTLSFYIWDNGEGIDVEDLKRIGRRYHTSKIRTFSDLQRVTYFGFRGESLYSLSKISNAVIVSKRRGCRAYILQDMNSGIVNLFDGENLMTVEKYFGFDQINYSGTIVVASNLFVNYPVRRSQALELSEFRMLEEIKRTISETILCKPPVNLEVQVKDSSSREFYTLFTYHESGNTNKSDMFAQILRAMYGTSLIPDYEALQASYKDYRLEGMIGMRPYYTRQFQYILMNGRALILSPEDNNLLNKGFLSAEFGKSLDVSYKNTAEEYYVNMSPNKKKRRRDCFPVYPVFVLHVDCPPLVDELLQDPSKSILHTQHWGVILKIVFQVFSTFLDSKGFSKTVAVDSPFSLLFRGERDNTIKDSGDNSDSSDVKNKKEEDDDTEKGFFWVDYECTRHCQDGPENLLALSDICIQNDDVRITRAHLDTGSYSIVRQVEKKFILIRTANGSLLNRQILAVIDQHACDERIRVEALLRELLSQLKDNSVNWSSKLSSPISMTVTNKEYWLFDKYRRNLETFAVYFVLLSDLKVSITAMPNFLVEELGYGNWDSFAMILQHLHDLDEFVKMSDTSCLSPSNWFLFINHLPRFFMEAINAKACRAAIKFGDALTLKEMSYMVEAMAKCKLPFQCAHGRPSIVPLATIR